MATTKGIRTGKHHAMLAVDLSDGDGTGPWVPALIIVDPDTGEPQTGFFQSQQVTPVNRSGTITLGGTAQTLMAVNTSRRGFSIQNLSDDDLYWYELGAATQAQPSHRIPAGGLYETPSSAVPTTAISIIGATTGQAFAAREWS